MPSGTIQDLGTVHEFQVEVFVNGKAALPDTIVNASISEGPHTNVTFRSKNLGRDGFATFRYKGLTAGRDTIFATAAEKGASGMICAALATAEWRDLSMCVTNANREPKFVTIDTMTGRFSYNNCEASPGIRLEGTGEFQNTRSRGADNAGAGFTSLLYQGLVDGGFGSVSVAIGNNILRRPPPITVPHRVILRDVNGSVKDVFNGEIREIDDPECRCN